MTTQTSIGSNKYPHVYIAGSHSTECYVFLQEGQTQFSLSLFLCYCIQVNLYDVFSQTLQNDAKKVTTMHANVQDVCIG